MRVDVGDVVGAADDGGYDVAGFCEQLGHVQSDLAVAFIRSIRG